MQELPALEVVRDVSLWKERENPFRERLWLKWSGTKPEPLRSEGPGAQPVLGGGLRGSGVGNLSLLCPRDAINILEHDIGRRFREGMLLSRFLRTYHLLRSSPTSRAGSLSQGELPRLSLGR